MDIPATPHPSHFNRMPSKMFVGNGVRFRHDVRMPERRVGYNTHGRAPKNNPPQACAKGGSL